MRLGAAGAVVICASVLVEIVVVGAPFWPSKVTVSALALHWAKRVVSAVKVKVLPAAYPIPPPFAWVFQPVKL